MKRPNIVLVIMDAARADRTSLHGYDRPTTPCLQQIARRGVCVDQFISAAAWTIPSHATFFSGLYPSEHRAHHHRIADDVGPLLAEALSDAGYRTIGVVSNTLLHPDTGLARGFDTFVRVSEDPERMRGLRYYRHFARAMGWRDSGAALANRRAQGALAKASKPFFLFINYMETHFPFLPPSRLRRRFVRRGAARWRGIRLAQQFMQGRYWSLLSHSDPAVFQLLADLYDGEIAYLDQMIGELADWLESARLLEDTILIITSDHGENLGDHNLLTHHFCLYDSLIHIPLLICWPGHLPEGERTSRQVSSADVAPSLAVALEFPLSTPHRPGPPRPNLLDWDTLQRSDADAYAEYTPPFYVEEWARKNPEVDLSAHSRRLWAIRSGGRKYIEGSDGRRELYDLSNDPAEVQDLAGADGEVCTDLAERLSAWRNAIDSAPEEGPGEEDPELMARLRSLGYI